MRRGSSNQSDRNRSRTPQERRSVKAFDDGSEVKENNSEVQQESADENTVAITEIVKGKDQPSNENNFAPAAIVPNMSQRGSTKRKAFLHKLGFDRK